MQHLDGAVVSPAGESPRAWVDRTVTALSEGRLDEVRGELAGAPPDDPTTQLLRAEIRLRTFATTTSELVALRDQALATEPGGGPRTVWASAILAEHLLFVADPLALSVAAGALDRPPSAPLPLLPEAYARARLLRVVSLIWLLVSPADGRAEHRRLLDEAVTLMVRYGLTREVTMTVALAAGVRAIVVGDDEPGSYRLLSEARRQFPEGARSSWTAMLDYALAFMALARHDLTGASEAAARLEEEAAVPAFLRTVPGQVRAYLRIVDQGAAPAALDEARAVAVAVEDPFHRAVFQRYIAGALADRGHPEAAEFGHAALALPPMGIEDRLERHLFEARLALMSGTNPDPDGLVAALEGLEDGGRGRLAGIFALRLAHDARRAGHPDLARHVHRWGLDHLPEPARRTTAEAIAARPLGEPLPGASTGGAGPTGVVEVAVLQPRLQVRCDGDTVKLAPAAALLLVLLTHAHPAPLHVEVVRARLWPDEVPGPNRLNALVHRLRVALGHPGAVVRDGPLVGLDERHCRVDLWEYRRQLSRPGPDRARALAGVAGNLCDAEFPYDEHLIDARHELVADWLHHVREALAQGSVTTAAVADAAAALGVGRADLEPVG